MGKIQFPTRSESVKILMDILKNPTTFIESKKKTAVNYRYINAPESGHMYVLEQNFIKVKTTLTIFPMYPIGMMGHRGVYIVYSTYDKEEYILMRNFVDMNTSNGNLRLLSSNNINHKMSITLPNNLDFSINDFKSLCIEYDKGDIGNYLISFLLEC